ncbi:DnaJ-domain-containing protein [Lentinus tigrinus ALCF2SS1-7]|uniref:DnaJ-domain-containing protein n=1 Tax=Lentinus tigrinus ALCF2SS1-7 TaxID=1328758 RepID=UPI001165EEA4|nr:DnaJ-domain-containing protein [Lentinus tigrinus ALCF2SS1-7]
MATNLYEILEITKEASPEEVRKAYRRRALQTHPDRLPQNVSAADKEAAEEQFRLVNNAYEVLNNAENRKLYDQHGVWPPPTEQPDFGRTSSRDAFSAFGRDHFANDPFFSSGFGRSRHPFAFTDPFELFNSLFGDLHSAFDNDPFFANTPFFRSPFDDPFFRTPFGSSPFGRGDPFGGSMFGRSPFAGMLTGGSMFPANENMPGARMYSSSTEAIGRNGHFVSRSQMTRTVNGRTEVIVKQVDAEGNEHITYKSPEGERYTINGIEQPARGSIEAPRRSGSGRSSRQQPAPIADKPANPPPTFAPPPPAAQAHAPYSVPVAGPSSSHAQRHSYAPPPHTQAVQPERRPSRHSHREPRASHDDPRRTYTTPIPAVNPVTPERERRYTADYAHTPAPAPIPVPTPVVPQEYNATAYRDAAPSRHSREKDQDRERERHHSKLRSSRDSRDSRNPAASVKRVRVDDDEPREKEREQRGWRGW